MTATTGEDEGNFAAFGDQPALNRAAIEVANKISTESELRFDCHNRPYVEICNCEFLSDAYRAAIVLFHALAQPQSKE